MIEVTADMRGFFWDRLQAALSRRHLEVTETTEFYLVELLARKAERDPDGARDTLAERLAIALQAETRQLRLRGLREVGDMALVACGFFRDSLRRRGITRDYAVALGGRAYASAGEIAHDSPIAEAYPELATSFDQIAHALDDVRESTALRTPQDIIRLYERWRKNGSPVLADRLREEGVFPSAQKSHLLH